MIIQDSLRFIQSHIHLPELSSTMKLNVLKSALYNGLLVTALTGAIPAGLCGALFGSVASLTYSLASSSFKARAEEASDFKTKNWDEFARSVLSVVTGSAALSLVGATVAPFFILLGTFFAYILTEVRSANRDVDIHPEDGALFIGPFKM